MEATLALQALARGDQGASERLLPLVYTELRAIAGSFFRGERANHTLQPTALVHEAYLRLIAHTSEPWNNRAHFMAVAATAMRQILTDYARRRATAKRGGDWGRISVDQVAMANATDLDVLVLDELLTRLAELDARKHRMVELRFFGGLTVEEVAQVMGVSKSTVEAEWRATRAWLSAELNKANEDGSESA
jgi:RNA polymerase sigma-70 factor (ECF subfamily)